jgi:acetyl-CoA C-acetyltransferase
MIAAALQRAGADSGTGDRLLRAADSVRCVPSVCWHYRDLAALVADELGAAPRETVQTVLGGNGPQLLVGDTAEAIAAGRLDVALIGGADAVASVAAARAAGRTPDWRIQEETVQPSRTLGEDRVPVNGPEQDAGLLAPVYMYALLESAVRARRRTEPGAHLARIAELWSRFSKVAAANPYAWIARAHSADEIATASARNRPVAAPYTKLLTANIQVAQASGMIVCSAERAARAGVPRDRWVFVHATAHAPEEWHVTERAELDASPAIRACGAAVLGHAGLTIDEIAHVDLYSCFPSAVEIAARELALDLDDPARPGTVTGGLTFFGGPGNNYSGHATCRLVELLRDDPEGFGLATAVGWYLSRHAVGVYSGRPPRRRFAHLEAQRAPRAARRAVGDYVGPAEVEAFTVPYDRDGAPQAAIVTALTPRGDRALVRTTQESVIGAFLDGDPAGWRVTVSGPARLEIEDAAADPLVRGLR